MFSLNVVCACTNGNNGLEVVSRLVAAPAPFAKLGRKERDDYTFGITNNKSGNIPGCPKRKGEGEGRAGVRMRRTFALNH